MIPPSHWRTHSNRVITDALDSGRAAGLTGKALLKHVDAAYPFGERAMHPHKIWLSARRELCHELLGPRTILPAQAIAELAECRRMIPFDARAAILGVEDTASRSKALRDHPMRDLAQQLAAGNPTRTEAEAVIDAMVVELRPQAP
jgi:hypothetical protein